MVALTNNQKTVKEILSEITEEARKTEDMKKLDHVQRYLDNESIFEDMRNLSFVLNDRAKILYDNDHDDYMEGIISTTITNIQVLLSELATSRQATYDYIQKQIEERIN